MLPKYKIKSFKRRGEEPRNMQPYTSMGQAKTQPPLCWLLMETEARTGLLGTQARRRLLPPGLSTLPTEDPFR